MMRHTIHTAQKGFTIVELMVATAIFATVLILCSMGLLQIGRVYYKGVTSARTQEAARNIVNEVSQAIQFGGGPLYVLTDSGGSRAICVGGKRFSYALNRQVVDNPGAADQSRHALVVDDVNCGPGLTAQVVTSGTPAGRELLSSRMRLAAFEVAKVYPSDASSNLFRIRVRVVTGDTDVLNAARDGCATGTAGTQFCATSELSTVVEKRVR